MSEPSPNLRTRVIEAMARGICGSLSRDPDQLTLLPEQESGDLAETPAWKHWTKEAEAALDAIAPLAAVVPREICMPAREAWETATQYQARRSTYKLHVAMLGQICESDITRKI